MSNGNTKEELILSEVLAVVSGRATVEAWQEAKRRTQVSLKELSYSPFPERYGLRRGIVSELSETRDDCAIPQLTFTEHARICTEAALMVKHLLDIEVEPMASPVERRFPLNLFGGFLFFLNKTAKNPRLRFRTIGHCESLT